MRSRISSTRCRSSCAGHRCVYEPEARSVEEAAESFDKEFRRKVRIVNRAWRATWTMPALLNPLRYGWFSLRAGLAQAAALADAAVPGRRSSSSTSLLIERRLVLSRHLAQCSCVLYAPGAAGYLARGSKSLPRALSVPYYFCLVNIASARGIIEAYRGRTYTTWATPRTANQSD